MRMIKTAATLVVALGAALSLHAQGRGGQPPGAPAPAPRVMAPIELTGNWVSVVTEDWRWRMLTPAKGDYASIPITRAAQMVADAWDPAADERNGEQCRAYGMPGLMRLPTRLRIVWTDDRTLKVDTDAGMQTRLLHFGTVPPGSPPSWQGDSLATWEIAGRGGPPAPARGAGGPSPPRFGRPRDCHPKSAPRLSPEERRSLQRQRDRSRVLGSACSPGRRHLACGHTVRDGPAGSADRLDHRRQLQERARRIQVGSVTVLGKVARCIAHMSRAPCS